MIALVIDDSKATRTLIEQILGDIGFEVAHATHGRHALESLKRIGPIILSPIWRKTPFPG